MRFVNIRELKSKTSEILRAAAGEDIIVTNHGKPIAVVSGLDAGDLGRVGRERGAGWVAENPPIWGEPAASHDAEPGARPDPDSPFPEERSQPGLRTGLTRPVDWNPLKAVFWDYPALTEEGAIREFVEEAHRSKDGGSYRWILSRFLERGRVIDVKKFFSWGEIRLALPGLKLSAYARKKWARMLDVYDRT